MRIVPTLCASLFALATGFIGKEALAQDRWSLYGGETVAPHRDMIYGEFGWPDAGFGWAHGISDKVDIGLRFGLIYGLEYTTNTNFGVDLRVPIRIQVIRSGKVSAMIHIDPGLKVYTSEGEGALFGPEFPFGFQLGFQVSPEAMVGFGVDLNMFLAVTPKFVAPLFAIAPLFGPDFEYHVDRNLGVGINMKFGPVIPACKGCGRFGYLDTEFGFILQVGLMYHF